MSIGSPLFIFFVILFIAFQFVAGYYEAKKYARLSHEQKVLYNLERIRNNTGFTVGGFLLGFVVFFIVLFFLTGWLLPLLFLV